MFCRGRIGHGADWSGVALATDCIGHGLYWSWIVLVMDCIGMGRTGSGCIALDHFVPRKRFIRNKVSFRCRLFHLNRFIGTKSRIMSENLDEHHFFAVNGNIAFTSAEVKFSTRLICSFDERNSKRSRLAKSYFCVLLKSRNEFTL